MVSPTPICEVAYIFLSVRIAAGRRHLRIEADRYFRRTIVAVAVAMLLEDVAPDRGLASALDLGHPAVLDREFERLLDRADRMSGQIENHRAVAGALDRADMRFAVRERAAAAAVRLQAGPACPRSNGRAGP